MAIRSASTEDSHGIALVHVSSWQDAYRGIVPQDYLDRLSVTDREQKWKGIFERRESETLVAEESGVIVGFVSLGKSRDDGVPSHVGEIYGIYVASSRWSAGVGRALWMAALRRLQELGFSTVTVWVLSQNERAIRFYRRAGFVPSRDSGTVVEIGGKSLPEVRYEYVSQQVGGTAPHVTGIVYEGRANV